MRERERGRKCLLILINAHFESSLLFDEVPLEEDPPLLPLPPPPPPPPPTILNHTPREKFETLLVIVRLLCNYRRERERERKRERRRERVCVCVCERKRKGERKDEHTNRKEKLKIKLGHTRVSKMNNLTKYE